MSGASVTGRASRAVEELAAAREAYSRAPAYAFDADHDFSIVRDLLALAEPYWWAAPICEVVSAAARTLPRWTARLELFPGSAGFFWFERPLELPGRWRAQREDGQYEIGEFDEPESVWRWPGIGWMTDGSTVVVVPFIDGQSRELPRLAWSHVGGYTFEVGSDVALIGATDDHSDPVGPQILAACLLFLEQRLVVESRERCDRPTRRRLEKAGLNYPEIRVIRLRTSHGDGHDSGPGLVNWRHRWLVRGHWRQQFHPSDQSHRPLWIAPYVKGPDDKPLKEPKGSVFAVVR